MSWSLQWDSMLLQNLIHFPSPSTQQFFVGYALVVESSGMKWDWMEWKGMEYDRMGCDGMKSHEDWGWEVGLKHKEPGSQSSIYWKFYYDSVITLSLKTVISQRPLGAQTSCLHQHSSRGCRSRMTTWGSPSPDPDTGNTCTLSSQDKNLSIPMSKVFGYWEYSSCSYVLSCERTQVTSQTIHYSPNKFKGQFLYPFLIILETDSKQNWETEKSYLWSISVPPKKFLLFLSQILSFLQNHNWSDIWGKWGFSWYTSYHFT